MASSPRQTPNAFDEVVPPSVTSGSSSMATPNESSNVLEEVVSASTSASSSQQTKKKNRHPIRLPMPRVKLCRHLHNQGGKGKGKRCPAAPNVTPNAFEEVVPPSASESGSSSKPRRWDVFINHRGPDTKDTIATSIYTTLKSMGLEVFLDQPELDLGDLIPARIQQAMTTSFLHIAILSPTYAESPWCLAELTFMLKTGKTVIPVFYKVEPGDIRWTAKGVYTDAFRKYQEKGRYSSEKIEDWKVALQNVSYDNGHIVKGNDDEGTKLLEAIQDYIKKHFEKVPLVLDNYSVGLDEMLQEFEKTAFDSSENIKIVEIVGMGGSGKTTLAKAYYNKTRYSIFKCIFIHNVRHGSEKDMCNLQKKMLQDLGFNDAEEIGKIYNVETGKAILAKHLRSVQVFIILDDVDCEDQLESLLPIRDIHREGSVIVGQGSVIIVTSRESKVFTSWGISSIYKMKELNPEHARKLFCHHAFRQPFPRNEFEILVEDFLKICQGLPLSLKVLGRLVQGESKACWDSTLKKVRRVLPEDIKKILKVSFDALDEEEKEIFLDICCFFIGEKEELAVTVWDGSGWSGLYSLQRLKSKCLVEVDEKNCITMHDHLQDMGREIANNGKEMDKSPYRLWSSEQIRNIEIEWQGGLLNRGIRGIRAETGEFFAECMELVKHVTGSYKWFKRRLEILILNDNFFSGKIFCTQELAALSEGLVWFRNYHFGYRALPSWLPLKKLRILEYDRCEEGLEELWSETADPPEQLRELVVSKIFSGWCRYRSRYSFERRFVGWPSSIGRLQHLKKISLCLSIEGLPDEFCRLQSLEYLHLSECRNLKSLPSNFGDLKNLRHLDLSETGLMMLPASFKHLINLQYIKLNDCSELTLQTDILENITKLEVMQCQRCPKITKLPAQIANQKSLKKLEVDSSSLMELPNNIGDLSKLEELTIGRYLSKVKELKTLPSSMGNLYSLTRLQIRSEKLETLPPSIGNLRSLTSLEILSEKLATLPPSIGNLYSLTSLKIGFKKLESLPEALTQLTSLQNLVIDWCTSLRELDILSGCCPSSLCSLKSIYVCGTLVSRISISQQCCPSLEEISLEVNHRLVEIDSLPISVKEISLTRCEKLKSISGVCGLVKLEKLVIKECGKKLEELTNFEELVSLKELVMTELGEGLKIIKGLEYCTSLERLIAHSGSKELKIIKCSLQRMESLRRVQLLAWNISAVQPCLQTIKKWPSECIVCARAGSGVEAALKSWIFPGLTLVDSCKGRNSTFLHGQRLKCGHRDSSNAAVIMCFVINLISDDMLFSSTLVSWSMRVKKGKWVWIGVFSQSSRVAIGSASTLRGLTADEDMGMSMMGEEGRVVDAFYQLLRYLGNNVTQL